MALTQSEWDALVEIVRNAAASQIMPRFRLLEKDDISTKSSPTDLVTLADIEAEAEMTEAIRAAWPGTDVVGEEAISADGSLLASIGTSPRIAILDPVDGTWNFAKGLALFGVIVAIAEAGETSAGMLYDPVLDDWIIADRDGPARYVSKAGTTTELTTSTLKTPEIASGYIPFGLLPSHHRGEAMRRFEDFARIQSLRCACHEYRMMAQGHAEFCLTGPVPNAWDHAAGALIVEQAGGVARMLDGSAYSPGLTEGHLLTAASEEMWALSAERLQFLLD